MTRFYGLKVNGEIVDVMSVDHEDELNRGGCMTVEYHERLKEGRTPEPDQFPKWHDMCRNYWSTYYIDWSVVEIRVEETE